jgi:hypothetical protein
MLPAAASARGRLPGLVTVTSVSGLAQLASNLREQPVVATKSKSSGTARATATHSHEHSAKSNATTDHETIRKWAEDRGAHPACVRGTGGRGDVGMIRLDFPGYSGADSLEEISWDEFFEEFDKKGLALLYQEETAAGQKSNFNKLVSRETAGVTKSEKS